jgi:hypothetical protein
VRERPDVVTRDAPLLLAGCILARQGNACSWWQQRTAKGASAHWGKRWHREKGYGMSGHSGNHDTGQLPMCK